LPLPQSEELDLPLQSRVAENIIYTRSEIHSSA